MFFKPNPSVPIDVKEMAVKAVVIRADGTQEDLGTIEYFHRNPFKMLWFKVLKALKLK